MSTSLLNNMSNYHSGNVIWLQWFSCCINEPAPPKKRPRRIDRTMIGLPTNFQHTVHVGSNEEELNNSKVDALQRKMESKGGYDIIAESSSSSLVACQ